MITESLIAVADRTLRTLLPASRGSVAPGPTTVDSEGGLVGMMRVDHSGEVCAQALYLAQALCARDTAIRNLMLKSAAEEGEHLELTLQRLAQLDGRASLLNPAWFAGAFAIGGLAALLGDRVSLGFLAETERQVAEHLDGHLRRIEPDDKVTRQILRRMRDDEAGHATTAENDGGSELAAAIRIAMRISAKGMTTIAARL